jgi:hypothetical protein
MLGPCLILTLFSKSALRLYISLYTYALEFNNLGSWQNNQQQLCRQVCVAAPASQEERYRSKERELKGTIVAWHIKRSDGLA